jgi:hypothetical protein
MHRDMLECDAALPRAKASNTHAYFWKLSKNSVDEVPQFLVQFLAYLDILPGHGR